MIDLVFFYGTLMSGFKRPGRNRIDAKLTALGRGWIHAALFDLGIYPAAIPASDSRVWRQVHRLLDPTAVLPALDEIEGLRPGEPDAGPYVRAAAAGTLDDGPTAGAGSYVCN